MNTMDPRRKQVVGFFVVCIMALSFPVAASAWEPNAEDLNAAVNTGKFAEYFRRLSAWLNQRMPPDASRISEAAVKTLLKKPTFANALAQRHLISKVGVDDLGAFVRGGRKHRDFLGWLLRNTEAMNLCLEGATPVNTHQRRQNNWKIRASALDIWSRIFHADPESKKGVCLKLAIATGLNPPGTGNRGAGQAEKPADPLDRCNHFKSAYKNGELFPSFETHTVWEYRQIVSSNASNADLAWARKMINTWRPDLRVNEQVVKSTSEVQYRNSPIAFDHTFKNVLVGGGKCGPRSSWAVFICQAFGIPVVGVRQPGHVCAAYKAANPKVGPQPGNTWKVVYGAGWHRSRVAGMSGPDFLKEMRIRAHKTRFSQGEHLRGLAAALTSKKQAEAVRALADEIQQSATDTKPKSVPLPVSKTKPEEPFTAVPGLLHVEAESFSKMSGGYVYNCYTGGKQVYFPSIGSNWGKEPRVDYTINVLKTGVYALTLRTATPREQTMEIRSGNKKIGTVEVPNSYGLWKTTPEVDVSLQKGKQTLMLKPVRPHRGVAVRCLELKRKAKSK